MGQIVATRSELRQGLVRVPLDERTKIIVVPDAVEREIVGMLFDSGRAFLWLDSAVEGLRAVHRLAVRAASGKDLLVVVHTERLGDVSRSEKLSSDRAAVVAAWLEGDVDKWLSHFGDGVPKKERWGAREDQHMLRALGDFDAVGEEERPEKADPRYDALMRGFQRSRGLEEDGIAGPVTRKQLVKEYFALAQVTDKLEPVRAQGEAAKANVKLAAHGAGPHFSIADADAARRNARATAGSQEGQSGGGAQGSGSPGASASGAPARGENAAGSPEAVARARIDFFFFFDKEGMKPAPGRADGEAFLEWVALSAAEHKRFRAKAVPRKVAKTVSRGGAHFRTGSAVMLPEGSAPASDTAGAQAPLTSVGMLAVTLRYNEEHPGHSLLIAGHTDSVGSDKENDKLSTERAELVHALLTGDRDVFVSIARDSSTAADWKQILKWAAVAFPSVEELVSDEDPDTDEASGASSSSKSSGRSSSSSSEPEEGKLGTGFSACDPGAVDDDEASGKPAVKAFQTAYNENYKLLGGPGTITVDGKVGKQTWGAIYDLYQYNMARELGETLDGVSKLRELLAFLSTKQPYIGFGAHHPADGNLKNDTESPANRRVELLLFAAGNEPGVEVLDAEPANTELYDRDAFEMVELKIDFPMDGSKFDPLKIWLYDAERQLMPEAPYRLVAPNGEVRTGRADTNGMVTEFTLPGYDKLTIQWGKREFGEEVEVQRDEGLTVDSDLPPSDEAGARAYFEYGGTLVLKKASRTITTMLGNLGHLGEESEQRDAFARFYETSDDATIRTVYFRGKSA